MKNINIEMMISVKGQLLIMKVAGGIDKYGSRY